jgi:succinoglycan biosynthesis transport protein ExoP
MGFGQFLSILRARWAVLAAVLALTVGTTVVVSLLLPKQFSATAAVVVDAKPDPIAGIAYPVTTLAYMSTQVDIIKSDRVAQKVIKNLNLADDPQVRKQWLKSTDGQGAIESWLVGALQKPLDVTPSRESNVIGVTYTADDPQFAASLANAFVQAYLDTAVELRVDPAKRYSTLFTSRSKELRENLERAQAKLNDFQRERGIIVSDERLDGENARLNELSTQLVMLQALSAESTSRSAQAGGTGADKLQEVLNNPVIASLKNDLSRAESRLQELNTRLGDNHPMVVEARSSVRDTRSRLESETRRVTGGVGISNTINRQREAEVRAALEQQRARVLKLKEVRDEGMVMLRDVESSQRAYDEVNTRLNLSSLESQASQTNVYPLSQAVPPNKASSPKVLLNVAVAIFIGGLLALGAVLLLESMDRRVRVLADVSETIGLPVLGVLPKAGQTRLVQGRTRMPVLVNRSLPRLPSQERTA